ncbi:LADA_0F11540g1_1 [Lachancea dasiensis]|uniref:Peroxin-3 n=1 Tax=Lachancea dasiensis TaxID=1072105 RepID=A0A1G4JMC9_9SACH|nr:LADA_0F11540g1_1 [Lachancea dasiensis]
MTNRSLWQRHKNKVLFSSATLAFIFSTGAVSLYLIKKWLWRQQLKLNEQQFVKEQIKRRFNQTQQDALYTIYELVPVLSLVLTKDLDVEEIVASLKGKKLSRRLSHGAKGTEHDGLSSGMSTSISEAVKSSGDPSHSEDKKTKAELWNDLKLKSLTKLCTVIYSVSSLLLLTRLQLNILARREYLETAVKTAVEKESAVQTSLTSWITSFWQHESQAPTFSQGVDNNSIHISEDARKARRSSYINEQAFLSFSWWLLNRGWLQYKALAEKLVLREFGQLNPRDTLTVEEFGERLSRVLHAINQEVLSHAAPQSASTAGKQPLQQILLPESNLQQFVLQQTLDSDALKLLYDDNAVLHQLLNETSNCVESTASLIVLESLINDAFQFTMLHVEENVSKKNKSKSSAEASSSENATAPAAPLADETKHQMALFSVSCKNCCDEMLKSGVVSMNNVFLQRLDSIPELDDLSASVYSNFGF